MRVSTDFLTYFFFAFCVAYNLAVCVLFLVLRRPGHRPRPREGGSDWPVISVLVPTLNEDRVVRRTVECLLALPYPGRLEALVVDDHSDDRTVAIVQELALAHANVDLLRRTAERSRRGKGDSLNHGFSYLCGRFPDRDRAGWVMAVFDADGRPQEDDLLLEVGDAFADPRVAAAQCGVRIRNGHHLLAALQDVEFATFSFVTQWVRDRTSGAVALGGNGQFVRASALVGLDGAGAPWDQTALTEDLDIGIGLHLAGQRVRFLDRWVGQEGVESLRALFRQRRRWAWGSLQTFLRYAWSGRLWRARLPWAKRLDLSYYLTFWIVPFVVLFSLFLSLLDLAGAVVITNRFGLPLLLANSFSLVPLIVLGLRRAGFPARRIAYLVPLTVVYAYHWVPVLVMAWASIIRHRRPQWAKTERYAAEEPMA
ncbi:MAG: glycosyltransferase family 2 protein [Candidatus Bipolaricaulaceae bacterium]